MDVSSIAAGLAAARMAQVQIAFAAKMMKMNAEAQASVVQLLDAAQANLDRLANVPSGVGTSVDVSA